MIEGWLDLANRSPREGVATVSGNRRELGVKGDFRFNPLFYKAAGM